MTRKASKVPGFQFAGIASGIKRKPAKDLALIYSEVPATAVGTFTPHPAAAAPVLLSQRHIRSAVAQAVVINSGNANACTGARGRKDAANMVKRAGRVLGISASRVLVCSTGVIGVPMPVKKVLAGIDLAAHKLKPGGLGDAARAILTTDKGPKLEGAVGSAGRHPYHLVSFAKGAGMIEPHMDLVSPCRGKKKHATMLAFVMTDLALNKCFAGRVLAEAVEASFNRISVDGDSSTNDTCLLLANGLAGNTPLKTGRPGARAFEKQLFEQLEALAKAMVADGEGATKVVHIRVKGAKNKDEARQMAYAIANSQLVRTSFFGADPNWGRVLTAMGNSGATCRPSRVDISYGDVMICRKGLDAGPQAEKRAKKVLQKPELTLTVNCNLGKSSHDILSSDLSLDYVTLNSCYRS